jgi:hypothetical protein
MSDALAEKLLQRYLDKISENAHICSLIDLFSKSESKLALKAAKAENIHTNYVRISRIGGKG